MFIIAGEFKVKAEHRAGLIAMSTALLQPSRREHGCLSYGFYEDHSEANRFLFFERWRDRASIDAHFQTNYFKDFAARFPGMIVGEAKINIYEITHTETL